MYVFWTFIVKTHPTEFGENLLWPIKEGVDEACGYLQMLSLTRIVSYKGLWVKHYQNCIMWFMSMLSHILTYKYNNSDAYLKQFGHS